jgi:hypothetical protein
VRNTYTSGRQSFRRDGGPGTEEGRRVVDKVVVVPLGTDSHRGWVGSYVVGTVLLESGQEQQDELGGGEGEIMAQRFELNRGDRGRSSSSNSIRSTVTLVVTTKARRKRCWTPGCGTRRELGAGGAWLEASDTSEGRLGSASGLGGAQHLHSHTLGSLRARRRMDELRLPG